MKYVRYGEVGREYPGIIDADGCIRDARSLADDWAGDALAPTKLANITQQSIASLPLVDQTVRIGPCVGRVGHFIAVGLNYADHAAEAGMQVPAEPVLFSKAPSCITGPSDEVPWPTGATKIDWEIELAIVIGKRGSNISEASASDHIAGFCICNDLSERSWQMEGTGQWLKGKSAPGFGPLGPWLVTQDELDLTALDLSLDVNGERRQTGNTQHMIFKPDFLVAYISRFMMLEPGDVITTGTPPGVGMGMKPPLFLKAGDHITATISGLGEQNIRIGK
jgi:2,4-didehydro-3-deoxy-L-rhamnonate hydrolase